MSAAGSQVSFDPLDPYALAEMLSPERGRVYDELGLCPLQRQAAEEAVAAVRRGQYPKARRP